LHWYLLAQEKIAFPAAQPLTDSDKRELALRILHAPGKVVLEFGALIKWIGMDPGQARNLADSLRRHADAAERAHP
jgi:hypothetical protein